MATSLGEKIRLSRRQSGQSLAKLATKLGTSAGYLSEIENDKKVPGGTLLIAIAKELGLSFDACADNELGLSVFNVGGLDSDAPDWDAPAPNDNDIPVELLNEFILVPRYNVAGSCGGGAIVDTEDVVEYLSFRREWIKNSLRVGEKDLCVISVKGDSMEPRLKDGDVVLLDTSTKHIEDNAIYALQFNGGLSIKRVQRFMSGALEIISDNKLYKAEMIPPEQSGNVRVVGRVVWAGGKV